MLLNATVTAVEGRSGEQIRVNVEDAEAGSRDRCDGSTDRRRPDAEHGRDWTRARRYRVDARGNIVVNERLETTAADVWAVGDCAGSPQFTHVAFDDFRIVRDNLTGGHRTTRERLVPFCMFTDPELARVGLNEIEAKRRGVSYRVATIPMAAVLRTRTLSEPVGSSRCSSKRPAIGFWASQHSAQKRAN